MSQYLEASRSIFSSRFLQNRQHLIEMMQTFTSSKTRIFHSHQHQNLGGAERDRTADPLLAKQVLSQLSYSPIQVVPPGRTRRSVNAFEDQIHPVQPKSRAQSAPGQTMVGPGRLELPTPRLSSVCSNRLSYGPKGMEHHDNASKLRRT